MQYRTEYLERSLYIEKLVTFYLASLLEIDYLRESRSFSNESSALSFNAKVNLFLDLGLIEKMNYWKFQKFMEIRNQFMHNLDASDYLKCFRFVKDSEKLLKTYPQPIIIIEENEKLRGAALDLANEVNDLCKIVSEKIAEIQVKKLIGKTKAEMSVFLPTLIEDLKNKSLDGDTISYKELVQLHRQKLEIFSEEEIEREHKKSVEKYTRIGKWK